MQEDKPEKEVARLTRELAVEVEKVKNRDEALAGARDAIELTREKLAQLEESRAQAIAELEAARETAEAALEREDEIRQAKRRSETERHKTIKALGKAASERERYKHKRDDLTILLKAANIKIRELIEDKEKKSDG